MQIIRTILWVIITAILVAFIAINWTAVPVNFWPLADGKYVHFQWPVGVVALVFFLLGAAPMWLIHRAGRWRLKRRINSLENTVAATSTPATSTPVVTSNAPATTSEQVVVTPVDRSGTLPPDV